MHNISKREKLTYTGSLLGQNMIYSLMTMYVMFFFTDLLRIPSQSVTIIMVAASLWGKEFAVPLTLGMLTVRGFANLLVAGRALSVDHLMAGLLRMQRCMQKTGEIAGRAAALSVQANCSVREIDSEALAAELRTSGCLDATLLPPCTFPEMPDVLEELLRGPKPGMAIWQASRNLDRYRGLLLKLLSGSDRHAAANAALALGLAGVA